MRKSWLIQLFLLYLNIKLNVMVMENIDERVYFYFREAFKEGVNYLNKINDLNQDTLIDFIDNYLFDNYDINERLEVKKLTISYLKNK